MSEPFHAFAVLAGLMMVVMCCAATATFAIASVSRWMKWSPVNIIVNVNNYGDAHGILESVEGARKP